MFVNLVDLLFLTATFLPLSSSEDIFDVTTIYDVKQLCETEGKLCPSQPSSSSFPVRVHKRTNALGLNLISDKNPHKEYPSSDTTLFCDFTKSCEWERKGWFQGNSYENGSTYSLAAGLKVGFSNSSTKENNKLLMIFTPTSGSIADQDRINVLEFFPTQDVKVYSNCKAYTIFSNLTEKWTVKDRNNEYIELECDIVQTLPFQINATSVYEIKQKEVLKPTTPRPNPYYYDRYSYRRSYPTVIDSYIHVLELYSDGERITPPSWKNLEVNYMSFHWDEENLMKPFLPSKDTGLKSTDVGSWLTSPVITPISNRICLVLIVSSSKKMRADVLQISVKDSFEKDNILITLNKFKAGWQIKQINLDVSNISAPMKLTIEKLNPVEIEITRISTCSSSGSEVEVFPRYVVSQPFDMLKNSLPIYTASIGQSGEVVLDSLCLTSRLCLNGGVNTTMGCACPPGFKGSVCQTGCGRNRFGEDCGGKCSLRSQECEGLILCTSFTGCQCAPGYRGTACKTTCWSGLYGNDCKQTCGQCAEGECDTFTGVCTACALGYRAPYCKQGCGRNRFGEDCGGKCSLRSQECEGLILCTSFTGCQCAPGYRGTACKTTCWSGLYGNDCKQTCGQCAEGECDTFTGVCTACALGYRAPYCKQEFVYLSKGPTLTSEQYETITVSFNIKEVEGYGQPKLYQIQYREQIGNNEWKTYLTKSTETVESEQIKENIDGLKDGIVYEVRVLLMDSDFNKYDGILVKSSKKRTKCFISDEFDYNVQSASNRSAITFSWTFNPADKHWCPVEEFELSWKEDWQWLTNQTKENQFTLTDLLPGSSIDFKIRAITSGGDAPFSKVHSITTDNSGSDSVVALQVASTQSRSLELTWSPPPGNEDRQIEYTIYCKCLLQVACPGDCEEWRQVNRTQTGVDLTDLLPFTRYSITVTPEGGPGSTIYAGTAGSVPTEVAKMSDRTPVRTNTSVTVFWESVPVCTSFLLGYKYQLLKADEDLKVIEDGFTKNTNTSFHNLTASTEYVVRVFINNLEGWNPESFLAINVTTSASVPEAVQNLTVYKKGRSMLGLRWAEPRTIYGKLKTFTIQNSLGKEVSSVTVEPTFCAVWPQLYCHTIDNLKPNRNYTVTVSARNIEVEEDGAVSSVSEITKEGAPTVPQNLIVHNRSSTTVGVQWRYPEMANGIVRSFVVTIEESEKLDQDTCCQDFPLIEILVREELEFYTVEISELHPAATYYVSVSAKTVTMGPSQSLVVSTRPPHLPISVLPSLQLLHDVHLPSLEQNITWLSQENLSELNSSEIFSPLIKTQLVLVVLNDTSTVSDINTGIKDSQLLSLLNSSIKDPFYFLTEYNKDGLLPESNWGLAYSPRALEDGHTYQLVAVQVTEYNGVYNVDLRYSSQFSKA